MMLIVLFSGLDLTLYRWAYSGPPFVHLGYDKLTII